MTISYNKSIGVHDSLLFRESFLVLTEEKIHSLLKCIKVPSNGIETLDEKALACFKIIK